MRSNKLVMEVFGGSYYGVSPLLEEPGVEPGDIPQFDSVLNIYSGGVATYNRSPTGIFHVSATLAYVTGKHDLKFGYQPSYQWAEANNWSISAYHRDLSPSFAAGLRIPFRLQYADTQ